MKPRELEALRALAANCPLHHLEGSWGRIYVWYGKPPELRVHPQTIAKWKRLEWIALTDGTETLGRWDLTDAGRVALAEATQP